MNIINGKILKIERKLANTDFEKDEVVIRLSDDEQCKVEFRGVLMMKALKAFREGDYIQAAVKHEGKVSKSTGIYYNNLIAKSIKPL